MTSRTCLTTLHLSCKGFLGKKLPDMWLSNARFKMRIIFKYRQIQMLYHFNSWMSTRVQILILATYSINTYSMWTSPLFKLRNNSMHPNITVPYTDKSNHPFYKELNSVAECIILRLLSNILSTYRGNESWYILITHKIKLTFTQKILYKYKENKRGNWNI